MALHPLSSHRLPLEYLSRLRLRSEWPSATTEVIARRRAKMRLVRRTRRLYGRESRFGRRRGRSERRR